MPKSKSKVTARAAGRKRQQPRSSHGTAVNRFYAGLVDTFRLPDTSTAATGIMALREDQAVTANGDGDAFWGWTPQLASTSYTTTITAGTLGATFTPYAHPQYQTVVTPNVGRSRMNAWRFEVRYTGAALNCSGSVYIGATQGFTGYNSTTLATYTPLMKQIPCTPGMTLVFYGPRVGDADFDNSTATNFMANYFSQVMFIFRGLPANAQCLSIRVTRALEYMPQLTTSPLVDLEPEPYDPVGMAEAGLFGGTFHTEAETQSAPSWTARVGKAMYDTVRGVGAGAVDAAREDLRNFMGERRMPMLEL